MVSIDWFLSLKIFFEKIFSVAIANETDLKIPDLEIITFTYNNGVDEIKFKIDEGSRSFGFSSSVDIFPLSSSVFDHVTENSVFTFAYDPSVNLAYIGYYNENSSYLFDSITSSSIGKVYSMTATYSSGMASNKFYSIILDYHNESASEKNFDIIGAKTFDEKLDVNAASSMVMNYNLINYKNTYPTHW